MSFRSLIQLGNSFAVTMPNEFTEPLNIKKKEKVDVLCEDNYAIVFFPDHKKEEEQIEEVDT